MPVITPYVPVPAVAVGGDALATLPAVMFARRLLGLSVTAVRGASVVVYMGNISPSNRMDQNPNGWGNTADYAVPRPIPPGTAINVVWPGQGINYASCSVTFHLDTA